MKYARLFSLLLFFSLFACTNLDEKLYDQIDGSTYFRDEAGFRNLVLPLYSNLYSMGGHGGWFSLQEISSDEIVLPMRGGDWGDDAWVRAHQHDLRPYDQSVINAWIMQYTGITQCNRTLLQIESAVANGQADAQLAAKFSAEIRALRALFYYFLLDTYGNIPIVTDFENSGTIPANTPRAQVFAFVEQELLTIMPLLVKSNDKAYYARMNYYAGQALLSKLYLNAAVYTGTPRWNDCLTACNEIIQSGLYSLEPNYRDNFKTNNQDSREFIFAIPYDQTFAQGFNLAHMTLHYNSQATFNLASQPWNGYCSLQEFYNKHEDHDIRKQNFLEGPQFAADGVTPIIDPQAEPNDPDGPQLNYTPDLGSLGPNTLRQAGVRIGKYEFELGATQSLSNDMPLFRYADILLMKAECLWRLDNSSTEALQLVNQVRNRSIDPDDPFSSLTAQNLLDERGREMFFEGVRRQDLIRFGVYGNPTQFMPGSDPCKEIWPIPATQLFGSANLVQNPCY